MISIFKTLLAELPYYLVQNNFPIFAVHSKKYLQGQKYRCVSLCVFTAHNKKIVFKH